jgi:glycerol uptake facilitator-like aquaporin
MFRKDIGHFPRPLGLAYMLFQFGGGVCGALLSWLFQETELNVVPSDNKYAFNCIVIEVLGTFLVTLFYLT